MSAAPLTCPVPGCPADAVWQGIACRTHWFELPAFLRGRLIRREYLAHDDDTSAYLEARQACLEALGVPTEVAV